jgi:hypothetical protein
MIQRRHLFPAVVLAAMPTLLSSGSQLPAPFEWGPGDSSVSLLRAGKPVWQFRYGKGLAKPMFHPLALVDGTVLTWDAPPDHPWHHALWFSWKYLNHANYWEEGRGNRGITEWTDVSVTRGRDFSAVIRMDLAYHEPGRAAVLKERREIRVSAPIDGQYHLDWTMSFTAQDQDVELDRTPILGEEKGQAGGGYAGLSVRFAQEFGDWKAASTKGPVPQDTSVPFHGEREAPGIDFNGKIAGRDAGVAVLDYPANLNSPTPWYTIMNKEKDFSFLQAALIYYRPHVLKAQRSLTLRYRLVVHEGRWSAGELRTAQANYVREVDERK